MYRLWTWYFFIFLTWNHCKRHDVSGIKNLWGKPWKWFRHPWTRDSDLAFISLHGKKNRNTQISFHRFYFVPDIVQQPCFPFIEASWMSTFGHCLRNRPKKAARGRYGEKKRDWMYGRTAMLHDGGLVIEWAWPKSSYQETFLTPKRVIFSIKRKLNSLQL